MDFFMIGTILMTLVPALLLFLLSNLPESNDTMRSVHSSEVVKETKAESKANQSKRRGSIVERPSLVLYEEEDHVVFFDGDRAASPVMEKKRNLVLRAPTKFATFRSESVLV